MTVIRDAVKAMKEVILLTDKIEKTGNLLTDISAELRDHDRRLIRVETRLDTYVEIAQGNKKLEKK